MCVGGRFSLFFLLQIVDEGLAWPGLLLFLLLPQRALLFVVVVVVDNDDETLVQNSGNGYVTGNGMVTAPSPEAGSVHPRSSVMSLVQWIL